MVDYKLLLKKHIAMVGEVEGVSYIEPHRLNERVTSDGKTIGGEIKFTQEEADALWEADREADELYKE